MSSNKYDITARKKAEINALSIKVLDAKYDVEQFQAIVTSLNEKALKYQSFLATAEAKRDKARNNKSILDQLIKDAEGLLASSKIMLDEVVEANTETITLASEVKTVLDDLIYCAELINKLSNIIIRKKSENPLISDELVTMIGTAGKDADNAVALTLVALKSVFTAQASTIESEAASTLEYKQSIKFLALLTGHYAKTDELDMADKQNDKDNSLQGLLNAAYNSAKQECLDTEKANQITLNQLSEATNQLNKAQIKLNSLSFGLAAAEAAALAS